MCKSPEQSTSKVDQIVAKITRLVQQGSYKPDEKLPSIRKAALDQGVSKNTVAEAYDRLVGQGLLKPRLGSGYYIARFVQPRVAASEPYLTDAIDLVSLLREQLDQHYEVRPGDGRPPSSWMESSELRRHFMGFKALGPDKVNFGYGSPRGYTPLLDRLRVILLERSISVAADGLLMTYGANHGFDLIIRHLLEPKDVVFVDSPGYYPLFAKLALANIQTVGIRRGPDGPDIDDLHAKLAEFQPKAFFTQSQAHNPTGGSLTLSNSFGLLQAAERHGFHVIEDDTFADILPSFAPRLAAIDQLDRVIYVGSFSKTLSANLRCGFIAAKPATVMALLNLKMITVVTSSNYIERFVFSMIHNGHYVRHLRRLRARLEEANIRSLAELEALDLSVWPKRFPGFYLWVELPSHIDEHSLCRAAASKSIFLAPGQVFRPSKGSSSHPAMRVNVAYGFDQRFLEFLKAELLKRVV